MRSEILPLRRTKTRVRDAVIVALAATVIVACSRPTADERADGDSPDEGSAQSTEVATPGAGGSLALLAPSPTVNPTLLRVDGHEIRYDDVAAQVALHALSTGKTIEDTVGADWFERASIVRDFTHRAAEYALLPPLEDADADPALIAAWDALSDEQRASYAPLDAQHVLALAKTPALRQAWVNAQLAAIDDDVLWDAWVQATETVRLQTIMVENHGPSERVAELLREADEIERFYRTRGGEFALPARAEVSMIRRRVPEAEQRSDHPDRALLADLRAQLLAGASFSELATEHSQDASAERGGAYGIIHPNQFAGALQLEEGAISEVGTDDAGYYLLRIDRRIRPELLPLDDGLRRRIANRLARERYISASSQEIVQAIEAAWGEDDEDALGDLLEEHGLRMSTTVPFAYPRMGSVPHVGWAPELADAIFAELTEPGAVIHRVTHRGVAVVRLMERTPADREAFARSKDAFAVSYRQFVERSAWGDYVSSFDPLNWDVDVDAAARVGERRASAP